MTFMVDTSDPIAAEASNIRDRALADVAKVKANGDLTDLAKSARSAEVLAAANERLADLEARTQAAQVKYVEGLKRQVFTPAHPYHASASDKIAVDASFRDGIERAGRTAGPDEMLALVNRAVLTGDKLMAKAGAAIAMERGDTRSVDAYLATLPDAEGQAYVDYYKAINVSDDRRVRDAMAFVRIR